MQLPPPVTTIFNFIFQMGLPQNKTKNTAALPPKDIIEHVRSAAVLLRLKTLVALGQNNGCE